MTSEASIPATVLRDFLEVGAGGAQTAAGRPFHGV